MTRLSPEPLGKLAVFLAVAATFGCGACGPTVETPPELPSKEGEQYAKAMCGSIETCGCAQSFESREACEAEYHMRFDRLLEARFDVQEECFEQWLAVMEADPCLTETPPPGAPFACAALFGRKEKGAVCEAHHGLGPMGSDVLPLRADECRAGLSCLNARCVDTPLTNELGTLTELAEGSPCGPTYMGFCRIRELYCHPAERVCWKKEPVGSACFDGGCEACTVEGEEAPYCANATLTSTGTCTPAPRIGEACDPLELVACGVCGAVGWCDPATSTCREGRAPRLCVQVAAP